MVYSKDQLGASRNKNLFCWATKELSQDAIIAWILCGESGKAFLKSLTSHKLTENEKALPEEFEIEAVYAQDNAAPSSKIDIFVEIVASGKKYAVIIEDKTDSWIHDQQLLKYVYSTCTKKEQRHAKYAGIFVVVVKTGAYYFWEHEQLKAEAATIRENAETPSWIFAKQSDDIQKKLNKIARTNVDVSFSYFLYEDYYSFIHNCDSTSAWMKDYIDYLSIAKPKESWMTNREHTVNDLIKRLLPTTDYPFFIRRPTGGGKKSYSVEINVCGKQVINRNRIASIKERLCLLVYVELNEEEKTRLGMNCHLFLDENQPAGYCPSKEIEAKIQQADRERYQQYRLELQRDIWDRLKKKQLAGDKKWKEIKSIRDLQVCTFECNGNNCFESDELGKLVQVLVETAEAALCELQNENS